MPDLALELDLVIADPEWKNAFPRPRAKLMKALRLLFTHAGIRFKAPSVALAIVFSDDAQVKDLNYQYRGKNSATNVLSFSPYEDAEILRALRKTHKEPLVLGDIILARETVACEAKAQKKSVIDHTLHLVLHGCLHLLGHDHQENDQADAMEAIEIKTLAALGIDNPYTMPHP